MGIEDTTENIDNPMEAEAQHILSSQQDVTENITGNEPAPAEGQPPEGGQQVSPDFDPQTWKLNYKGQDQFPKDREHLVNLAQKGIGYERAMEQLNQERSQLTESQNKYGRYATLEQAFQSHPELAQQVWGLANQYTTGQTPQQGTEGEYQEPDPQVTQLQNQLQDLTQWKDQLTQQKADDTLQQEANQLMTQFPNHEWGADTGDGTLIQRLYNHCYQNNIPNLQLAYKDYFWDSNSANSKADALRGEKERRQSEHRQGIVSPGSQPLAPAQTGSSYSNKDSYSDLVDKATHELGG